MEEGRDPFTAEFLRLTGLVLPPRVANRLEDRVIRRDPVFQTLATWCFDHPHAVEPLRAWARGQAERSPEPRAWELRGYLDYLAEDWPEAARAFLRSLEAEPENLDAWLDLAFCFQHMGLGLGESILFHHDEWIRLARERSGPWTLSTLYRLEAEVEEGQRGRAADWVGPFLRGS